MITDSHWPFCGGVELRHIPLSRCDNHFAIHGIAANSSVGFLFHHFPQYNDEPIDPIPNFPNKNQEFYYIVHVGMTNTVYIYISLSLDIYIYMYISKMIDSFVLRRVLRGVFPPHKVPGRMAQLPVLWWMVILDPKSN